MDEFTKAETEMIYENRKYKLVLYENLKKDLKLLHDKWVIRLSQMKTTSINSPENACYLSLNGCIDEIQEIILNGEI